jgi:subtilisin family serine protease
MDTEVFDTETYIVVRDLQRTAVGDPFGGAIARGGLETRTLAPPEPKVDIETLDRTGRTELLQDPSVAGITPKMPTRLIEPFEEDGGGSGGGGSSSSGQAAWGIAAVRADQSQFTGADVVVAVLDTGIDGSHAAFNGVAITEEDFSGSGNGDRQGHGTHCAGTIFGRDVDGQRIGVARGVSKALIGKVLSDDGSGDSAMIFAGLQWAFDNGANIVSMSLGFDFPGLVQAMVDAEWPADLATSRALEVYRGNLRVFDTLMELTRRQEAFGRGAVVVAAAGNESKRQINPNYEIAASIPAAAEGVISVGALGQGAGGLNVAPFSNTFPVVSAPGVGIASANVGGGTRLLSGTSMACPHVAGVAALWWEQARQIGLPPTPPTVTANLRASARRDVFVQNLDPADRGIGLVTAP